MLEAIRWPPQDTKSASQRSERKFFRSNYLDSFAGSAEGWKHAEVLLHDDIHLVRLDSSDLLRVSPKILVGISTHRAVVARRFTVAKPKIAPVNRLEDFCLAERCAKRLACPTGPVHTSPHAMKRTVMLVLIGLTFAATALVGQSGAKSGEWPTYGGDLGHTRYSPLDQINAGNFAKLEVAWRFKTDSLGPRPEFQLESTPLMVGGRVFSTGGTRRAVVALDAATGELLWMHSEHEGARGAAAPRQLSGRGLCVLDRRQGGTDPLRHAGLSARRARREEPASRSPASAATASSI